MKNSSYYYLIALVLTITMALSPFKMYGLTPVLSFALLSGVYFNKGRQGALSICATLLGIDMLRHLLFIIGLSSEEGFYEGQVTNYALFGICSLLAHWGLKSMQTKKIILVAFGSSIFYFVFSNLSVWLFSSLYVKSMEGLMLCYTKALPFYRMSLLGDVLFALIFVKGYAAVQNRMRSASSI